MIASLDDEAVFEPEIAKEAILPALLLALPALAEGAGAAGAAGAGAGAAGAAGAAGLGAAELAGGAGAAGAAGAGAGEVAAGMGAKEIAGGIGKQVLKNQVIKSVMPHGNQGQGPEEPAVPAGPSGPSGEPAPRSGWNALDYGARAELHEQPEGALPFTDGADDDDDPFRGAGDIRSTDSLEPENIGFASTGSLDEVVAQFQATAGAQMLQRDSRDDLDIAGAAKQFLAKEALKAFTPGEQYQIINEGDGVKAANLDRLDLAGTHYTALEAALVAAEDDEDDKESWLA
jgi:hypothetical protein